jgi:predicted transcriptional regulator
MLDGAVRITLHGLKTPAFTIRLDPEFDRRLARAEKRSGRTRSDFVRDALRRQLAIAELDGLRRRIMPFAEAQGYVTGEDVFRGVS